MISTLTTTISRTPCEVEYEFQKGDPMVRYYRDGSGYPGSADECTLLRVDLIKDGKRLDVLDYLSDEETEELEGECMEDAASSIQSAMEAAAEAQWETRMEEQLQEAYD